MTPAVRATLADLCDFGEMAARLVARGRKAWDDDEVGRLAGEAIIHRIGEAVARLDRLDPDFVQGHPEVSWRPMKGMRNIVAHEYGAVDHNIIWNALETDLPRELARVRRIIEEDAG